MSFRATHFRKAAEQIEETTNIVELAKLEADELAGGEHRPSLVAEFTTRARALAETATEDEHLQALEILDEHRGKSIVLAALEGDSRSDDGTGPGESREGGESPSEAADSEHGVLAVSSAQAELAPPPDPEARPKPRSNSSPKPSREPGRGRPVGRLVRRREPDGTVTVTGLGNLRARRL